MRRRDILGGAAVLGGAAALPAVLPDGRAPVPVRWATKPCPNCGVLVAFLRRQRVNTCGFCQARVVR